MGMPVSETDAEIFYREICKSNDIVYPLVRVFKKEADPPTLRLNHYYGDMLCARMRNPNLDYVTTTLSSAHERGAILSFYSGEPQDILERGRSDSVFCQQIACLAATPKMTGIWAFGAGHEMAYTLSVRNESITLPSELGKWFFDLMSWLALISTEHKFPHERETFWEGNKENPD